MGYKKYTKDLLLAFAGILAAIVILNYLVNPYNIFKQRIFKHTLLKPEAKIQERITKPIGLKIDNRKIDAIFFGSSRVDLAINKEYYKKLTGKEAENIAIGGLRFYEMLDAIDIALKIHPEIKNIYIGLDYETFLKGDNEYKNRAVITKNTSLDASEIAVSLLCVKTTGNSIWTVIKNLSGNKKRMFYANGTKYIYVNKKINKDFEKAWVAYNNSYSQGYLDTSKVVRLKEFYEKLNKDGKNVTLFLMPCHITELYFIYRTDHLKYYEDWKKKLVDIAPVYDFQYSNKYIQETIKPDMQTCFDAGHVTYIIGNKIIEDIVLNKGNFARYLTKDNVDKYNVQNRNEMLEWTKSDKKTMEWINNTLKEEKNAI